MEPDAYHHGNVRAALISAGVALGRADGPEAIVMREAARQVGVSHNAGYRHFRHREDFRAAVAQAARERLIEALSAAAAHVRPTPDRARAARARLRATAHAYIAFAHTERGLFRTAFCAPEPVRDGTVRPQDLITGSLGPDSSLSAQIAAWSVVHGLAVLLVENRVDAPLEELIDEVLHVVETALAVGG